LRQERSGNQEDQDQHGAKKARHKKTALSKSFATWKPRVSCELRRPSANNTHDRETEIDRPHQSKEALQQEPGQHKIHALPQESVRQSDTVAGKFKVT
jgi:hypothetical protein